MASINDFCASCTHLNDSIDSDGKYYCDYKGRVYACDPKCPNYCEAYSRSNNAKENMYSNSKEHQTSGCYITTVMCNILGFKDNCYTLQTLRKLRNNMQNNPSDVPLLLLYDQVGPKIAKSINNDQDKEIIANKLYDNYITKAVTAIENKKENLAKDIYITMTYELAKYYQIPTNIIIPDKIDKDYLGHAKKRKMVNY